MNTKLSQVFKNMSQVEPSIELKGLILRRFETEKAKQMKRKLAFSYFGLASSLVAGVWAIVSLGNAILKSEFWSILSLAFSDLQVVARNWNTYLYSLLETLPTVSLVLILIPIFGLIMSVGFYLDLRSKNNYFKLA